MLSNFLENEIRKLEKEYDINIDVEEREDIKEIYFKIEDNRNYYNTVITVNQNSNDIAKLFSLKKKLAYLLTVVEIENDKINDQLKLLKGIRNR